MFYFFFSVDPKNPNADVEAGKENMMPYNLSCSSTVQVWHSSCYSLSTAMSRQRTAQITSLFHLSKVQPAYMRTETRKSEFIAHMFRLQFLLRSMQAATLFSFCYSAEI